MVHLVHRAVDRVGLAVIMLGMGLTLTVNDFRAVGWMPRTVALGFAAQFTIMPLLGWGMGRLFILETPFAVGLILVGCCPGGSSVFHSVIGSILAGWWHWRDRPGA